MNCCFSLDVRELQATPKGEILEMGEFKMLMMHFFDAPCWASFATSEGSGQSWRKSHQSFRSPIRLKVMQL
jgi:hypothetical protein